MKAITYQNIATLGRFQGISSVIADTTFSGGVNNQYTIDNGFPTVYQSLARRFALQICGWPVEPHYLEPFLQTLEKREDYERAAAIAVFNLDLRSAIALLNRASRAPSRVESSTSRRYCTEDALYIGAESCCLLGINLRLLSMALAGFSSEPDSLWHTTCDNLSAHISHPYLRACFAFLSKCCDYVASPIPHDDSTTTATLRNIARAAAGAKRDIFAKPMPAQDSAASLSSVLERESERPTRSIGNSANSTTSDDEPTSPRRGSLPFEGILYDNELTLRDRIAFASRYLIDVHVCSSTQVCSCV
jgi:hypothetical protein